MIVDDEFKKQHDFLGKCGLKKSLIDKRDYMLTYQTTQITLPDEFRLDPPDVIKDQGQTPMCASFSSSYIAEHINKLNTGKFIELSPSFVYANRANQDSDGMDLRDAEKILLNLGDCENTLFDKIENEPQLNTDYNSDNPDNLVKNASNYKTTSFAQVTSVDDIKISIMRNGYCHIGVTWYSDNQLNYDTELSDDNPYKKDEYVAQLVEGSTFEGGHALTIIGWSKKYNGWWCVNSWSKQYGNMGMFILPFNYTLDLCFTVLGKAKEPSTANTITSNVTPIIHKKSSNELIQTIWKIINWLLNNFSKH